MPSRPSRLTISAAIAAGTVVAGAAPVSAAPVDGSAALAPRARAVATSAPASVPTLTYQVQSGDTVWDIARRTGTSVQAILAANGLDSRGLIRVGQVLAIPSPAVTAPAATAPAAPAAPVTPAPPSAAAASVTVARGDSLWAIATRNGTTVAALKAANGLTSDMIHPGQTLRLPGTAAPSAPSAPATPAPVTAPATAAASAAVTVARGDSLWAIATRNGTTVAALMAANGLTTTVIHPGQSLRLPGPPASPAAPAPAAPAPAAPAATAPAATAPASTTPGGTITIARGDTLSGLAAKHGTTVSALMAANGLTTTTIYAGRTLVLPGAAAAPAAPATQLVPSTFLHYTYPKATVDAANVNKATLLAMEVPSREQMRQIVRETAVGMGVNPALALAIAMKESGFDQRAVSPANAVGTMQVIPSSGTWASTLVGRELNLLNPWDNATAGVAIIRQLVRTSSSLDIAIASYYQGAGSVARNGMYSDTRSYVSSVKALMAQFGG